MISPTSRNLCQLKTSVVRDYLSNIFFFMCMCVMLLGSCHRSRSMRVADCHRMCAVRREDRGGGETRPLLSQQRAASMAVSYYRSERTWGQKVLWKILCRGH